MCNICQCQQLTTVDSLATVILALTVIQKERPRWTWEEGPTSARRPFLTLVARGDLLQCYGKTSQGLKLWQRVRLGSQPQCLIGGMALETDVHLCHNASGVLYNAKHEVPA